MRPFLFALLGWALLGVGASTHDYTRGCLGVDANSLLSWIILSTLLLPLCLYFEYIRERTITARPVMVVVLAITLYFGVGHFIDCLRIHPILNTRVSRTIVLSLCVAVVDYLVQGNKKTKDITDFGKADDS